MLAKVVEVVSLLAVENMGLKEPIDIPRPARLRPAAAHLRLVTEADDESGLDPTYSAAVQGALTSLFGGGGRG